MAFSKSANNWLIVSMVCLLWSLSSCSTSRKLVVHEVKPMTTSKIIRKLSNETPKFKTYESKKISVSYTDSENKNNFSGQFKIDRDKCAIVTLKKLNLPLGRAYLSPDSLKFVNYYDNYFIVDAFSAVQKLLGFDIDYNLLQAFLTADVSSLLGNKEFDKDLVSYIDENMYRIDSEFSSKVDRAITSGNDKRLNRYMKKLDDAEFIEYTVWIDPEFFVIRKLNFNDIKYKESLTIFYDEYELVGRSLFPQKIALKVSNPKQNIDLEVKLSRPTVNKTNDFSFSIPEKYDEYKIAN